MGNFPYAPFLAVLLAGCNACASGPPPLITPFETVAEPRRLCGTPLETELRHRHVALPDCGPRATLRFVRARAGEHDVIVVVFDDQTPTEEDAPPDHGARIVVDGQAPPPVPEDDEGAPPDDEALGPGFAPPATEADGRAMLAAAILTRARTADLAWSAADRDRLREGWGAMRDAMSALPVGPRTSPDGTLGLRAFSATRDESYFGWRARIARYDAWLDHDGAVHVHEELVLDTSAGWHDRDPPWRSAE